MPDDILVSAENNISFGQLIAHWAKNPQEIPDLQGYKPPADSSEEPR